MALFSLPAPVETHDCSTLWGQRRGCNAAAPGADGDWESGLWDVPGPHPPPAPLVGVPSSNAERDKSRVKWESFYILCLRAPRTPS